MENKIKVYHGSHSIVRIPDLSASREDIDFGKGFYLSQDYQTSAKWACAKATSICNEYELDLTGLKIYKFDLDKTWLDYVVNNRALNELNGYLKELDSFDVLIGAIADDKLFQTLDMYVDGYISADKAIEIMNCMNYGQQFVLKSERAVKNLKYVGHNKIVGEEKQSFKTLYREDKREATRRTEELLKSLQ